ncbi:MAG: Tad domain-containing protein [Planctomycetota bacterium]
MNRLLLRPQRRRGYSLVFIALMLFGIMALAGLVIDLGFARLTQRQMQVAADSAAVEGLRGEGIAAYIDRRESARDFVHWHFDDDLDASGTYPLDDDGAFGTGSGQFGAGPQLTFSGGLGDPALDASRTIEVDPDNPVFKPVMEDGTQSAAGTFTVALRRGGVTVPTADLYAQGTATPYLFARGSLSNRQLIASGINIGANGVAEPRLAMSVGAPQPAQGMPGSLGMAIDLGTWQTGTQPIASTNCFVSNARVVGDPVSTTNAVVTNQTGYVGLFLDNADVDRRVVAFGFASVDVNGDVTIDTSQVVALENASAVFVNGFDPTSPLAAILEAIGPDGAALSSQAGIVHASVSVR